MGYQLGLDRIRDRKENERRNGKRIGRPKGSITDGKAILEKYPKAARDLQKGFSLTEVSKLNELSRNTVIRIRKALASAHET